ncbi:hypothetical protein CLIB1444_09S00892 [[Candida] jaroonii]|uniref:Uncharacterized protein n=1 Tax=[Candida] jaroonii TaxID=467808 RepID=A0ACA9YCH7_9ASCO|nr:hypothetical protein CLIB1444_09S00892 [[Candida] jaroonii]
MFQVKFTKPLTIFGLTVISCGFFYWSNFRTFQSSIDFNESIIFQRIIECSDIVDGNLCFKENKDDLLKEVKFNNFVANKQWNECLTMVNEQSDLNLLLNIQKCFHQSDLIDKLNHQGNKIQLFLAMASIAIQLFISIQFMINHSFKNHETTLTIERLRELSFSVEDLIKKVGNHYNEFVQARTKLNSDIKQTTSRLNKGGDYYRYNEILKENVIILNNEFNNFKIEFFTKFNKDFVILPPKINTFSSPMMKFNTGQHHSKSSTSPKVRSHQSKEPNRNFDKENNIPNPMVSMPNHKASSTVSDSSSIPAKVNQQNFDITTQQGREQLKKIIEVTRKEKNQLTGLKYSDVIKVDKHEKKFKRVFIPQRGWVPVKRLEAEELHHGSNALVIS